MLGNRLRGQLSDEDQGLADHLTNGVGELQATLVESRRHLDMLTTRVASLEGSPLATPADADWERTRASAHDLIALWEEASRRRTAPGLAGIAAGEQLTETLIAPDGAPEWLGALLDRFPNVDPGTVAAFATEGPSPALDGAMYLVRGFRGEQLVAEALAAGLLPVPPGTTGGGLAATTNAEGLDLHLDVAGQTVAAQVKIASGAGPILEHFSRNPGIEIVYTSSDAAEAVEGLSTAAGVPITVVHAGDAWPDISGPVVVDIGTGSGELTAETISAFEGAAVDADGGLLSDLWDELPIVALAFITLRGMHRYVASDDDDAKIRDDALRTGRDVLISSGVGTGVAIITGAELIKAPVTIATSILRTGWRQSQASIDQSVRRTRSVRKHLGALDFADRAPAQPRVA